MSSSKVYFYSFIYFFLSSCANVRPPGGGPQDKKAPTIKSSSPKDGQLNFKGREINIEFSEDISADNIQEQLLITPYIDIPYKSIVKHNKLKIAFTKDLPPDYTYTFNFRESIKDLTEGNTQNISLAFSTGTKLDSLSISGIVKDLMKDNPQENILVSLYPKADSIKIKTQKPLYFTKTKKDGTFSINNIKYGNYDLYAIEDLNKSLLYNENEKLAILKNIELTNTSLKDIELKISTFDSKPPEIKTIKEFYERADIQLTEGIQKFELKSEEKLFHTLSPKGNIITVYRSKRTNDSTTGKLQLIDSAGLKNEVDIKLLFKDDPSLYSKVPVLITLDPKQEIKVNPKTQKIKLQFTKPVLDINPEKINVKEDSIINTIKKENIKLTSPTTAEIDLNSRAKDSIILIFKERTLKSIDTTNTTQQLKFEIKKEENYSLLEINISTKEKNYLIQLLNQNYEPVEVDKNITKRTYTFLTPGTYYLRAIIDKNNNGQWDAGNINTVEKPEEIIVFKNKIQLRANWEVKDINFSF